MMVPSTSLNISASTPRLTFHLLAQAQTREKEMKDRIRELEDSAKVVNTAAAASPAVPTPGEVSSPGQALQTKEEGSPSTPEAGPASEHGAEAMDEVWS